MEAFAIALYAAAGLIGVDVRRHLHIGDQTGFETGPQPLVHEIQIARRPVGGDHDLLAQRLEHVERVEKLFLRLVLSGHELHVIDQP